MKKLSHTVLTSSQVVQYRASMKDHNKTIICTVIQEEYGRIHFTKTFFMRLHILKSRPVHQKKMLIESRTKALLSVLCVLLLFLCCLFSSYFIFRREKRKEEGGLNYSIQMNSANKFVKGSDNASILLSKNSLWWESEIFDEVSLISSASYSPLNKTQNISSCMRIEKPNNNILKDKPEDDSQLCLSARKLKSSELSVTEVTLDTLSAINKEKEIFPEIISRRKFVITNSKQSLGSPGSLSSLSLHAIPGQAEQEDRRTRKIKVAAPEQSSSSVFRCREGCFVEDTIPRHPQRITISTGPVIM